MSMKIKDKIEEVIAEGESAQESQPLREYEEVIPSPDIPMDTGEAISQPPIGKEQITKAMQTLLEYQKGKTNLEARIVEAYDWYRMRHWKQVRGEDYDENPASAWLFNSIANKHADAMDNYPEANVLPREEGDKDAAKQLSAIVPVIFEQNKYPKTYSALLDDLIPSGTCVTGVFWDRTLADGWGDISVKKVDVLSLYWKPGVEDIQDSPNLFFVSLVSNDELIEQYPHLDGRLGGEAASGFMKAKYNYDDTVDTSKESPVIEWYYKKQVGERKILHYCKFVADEVLYATENELEPMMGADGSMLAPAPAKGGLYADGKYPFEFTSLFPIKGTPCGFGYIDIMKDCQLKIDSLGNSIVTNADIGSERRFFESSTSQINAEDYDDKRKKFVRVEGSGNPQDSIMPIEQPVLPSIYVEVYSMLVNELKETSGNRDFSQGGTTAGVTAASAIAALQEAGSKLSRDMITQFYRSYEQVCCMVIERIRQFYDVKRSFRIIGEGGAQDFIQFDNRAIKPHAGGNMFGAELGDKMPIFDVKVKAQRQSPFSKISQNELAMELFGKGAFNPQLADQAAVMVEMMEFEGKDAVLAKIRNNGLMAQQIEAMKKQMLMLGTLAEKAGAGQGIVASLAQQFGIDPATVPSVGGSSAMSGKTNSLGKPLAGGETLERARERARKAASAK